MNLQELTEWERAYIKEAEEKLAKMKAKDTLLTDEEKDAIARQMPGVENIGSYIQAMRLVDIECKAQDTKSYKAGFKEGAESLEAEIAQMIEDMIAKGRAEVVEWVRANNMCTRDEFEVQCKAWGIEETPPLRDSDSTSIDSQHQKGV